MARRPRRSSEVRNFSPPISVRRVPHRRRINIDWAAYRDQLGQVADITLAARIGCTATAVYKARSRFGIPPFREGPSLAEIAGRYGPVLRSADVRGAFGGYQRRARRWLLRMQREGLICAVGATRSRVYLVVHGHQAPGLAGAAPEACPIGSSGVGVQSRSGEQ